MDAKTTIRKGVELWNAQDRDGFLALFDDSAVFIDPTTGTQFTGPEEIRTGWYDPVMDGYPDREVKDAVVFGEGELVCLQGRLAGTHTGTARDMPPTGRRFDTPFVTVFEVRDGKVTRLWQYGDRLLMLEQLGLVSLDKLFAAGAS